MIDLHVHSTMSDGTYSPSELMKLAKEKGLQAIALTDHDSISGNAEAKKAAKQYEVKFIQGMEMSLNYNNRQIHVVALGFDENNPAFRDFYADLRQRKQASIIKVINYLSEKEGLNISVDKVTPFINGGALDKYAILRYLIKEEASKGDIQYLWDTYIDPAFNNLKLRTVENPNAKDAIKAIKLAGGVTSLAHYHKRIGFKGCTREEQENQIKELHELGLDGMEAYYPNYTEDDEQFAHYLIKKYDLLPTGGTDFHGKNRPAIDLGTGNNNNMNVPFAFYESICKHISR